MPNGIDPDDYTRRDDQPAIRRRLGLDPARRYVTLVARGHPVKDHATLIRAFRRVADARSDVDLLLVGDGPLRPALEQQVAEFGLGDRVLMPGVRSDVPAWLQASDVFVLCSVSEAASITLLEAMACGLPSVVSAVGGNPELVRKDIDGFHVARGDDEGFARAILRLLEDDDLRQAMGAEAAARVRRDFRMSSTVETYGRLLTGAR